MQNTLNKTSCTKPYTQQNWHYDLLATWRPLERHWKH